MNDAHTTTLRKGIVLLPGLDGTGRLFHSLRQALDPRYETSVIPYPADRALTYPALCDHVRHNLPNQNYAIVAESFSGPIALEIANRKPKGLKAIILSASFARNPRPVLLPLLSFLLTFSPLQPTIPVSMIRMFLLGRDAPPEHCRELQALLQAVAPEVVGLRLREIVQLDAIAALKNCSVPLFYLNATEDRLLGKGVLRFLSATRPDMRVFHVPGPHMLLQALPELCARHIDTALNSIDWTEN
jgi:pimeloyl-ACP methyl ester carboxylesterase